MKYLIDAGILFGSYIFGAIPFGLIVVKLMSGKDPDSGQWPDRWNKCHARGRTLGRSSNRPSGHS